jgi:Lon-like ATP-dependent protease
VGTHSKLKELESEVFPPNSVFDIGGEACKRCCLYNHERCVANGIAIELLHLYPKREDFKKELRKHVIESEASEIEKIIEKYETEHNTDVKELLENLDKREYFLLYNELKNKIWQKLLTDRKDVFGMRNEDWKKLRFTHEIPVWNAETDLLKYVIGQEQLVEAAQLIAHAGIRRNIEMLGPPGTGKSLTAEGISQEIQKRDPVIELPYRYKKAKKFLCLELLNKDGIKVSGSKVHDYYERKIMPKILNQLPHGVVDVLSFYNYDNPLRPFIRLLPPGWGNKFKEQTEAREAMAEDAKHCLIDLGMASFVSMFGYYIISNIVAGLPLITTFGFFFPLTGILTTYVFYKIFWGAGMIRGKSNVRKRTPKVLVNNEACKIPFIDATGSRAMELLGSIRHDPLQGAGLGDPEHLRLQQGKIHEANGGILFIDEAESIFDPSNADYMIMVSALRTAMEDGVFDIRYHGGAGGGGSFNVSTYNKLPTRFILIVGGNKPITDPAIRNRMFARGYQVFVNTDMPNIPEYRRRTVGFVEQWRKIEKSKRGEEYLRFTKDAAIEVLKISEEMADKRKSLTVRFRDLGGYVMAANDLAKKEGLDCVYAKHVKEAKRTHIPLEMQELSREIRRFEHYSVAEKEGAMIGRVNALAVFKTKSGYVAGGKITPIEAALTKKGGTEQKIIATGKLKEIAKEAVANTSAVFKNIIGEDINKYDINLQYVQSYTGVEGDSAGLAMLIALISDYGDIPIDQSVAVTGALTVGGRLLPVGAIGEKVRTAQRYGLKKVIVPAANKDDVPSNAIIEVVYGENILDYLENILFWDEKNEKHKRIMKNVKRLKEKLRKIEKEELKTIRRLQMNE